MKSLLFLALLLPAIFLCSCKPGRQGDRFRVAEESLIDTAAGSAPFVTGDGRGRIVLSWIRQRDSASHVLCFAVSPDGGKTFGAPVEVPGSANLKPHGENMPRVVLKPSGEVLAVWGTANPHPRNAWSGLVRYSQSFDGGKTWTAPAALVRDTAGYDQRYFDVALLPGGEAAIIWLDNRKTVTGEGSALYLAVTQGKDGFRGERLVSQPCCPCCRTDLFVDGKGGIHVLYRGIWQDSIRDMVHRVSADGGSTFSVPRRISEDNWVLRGCPHTGPAMGENSEGMHFAWFTGGAHKGSFYSRSADGGRSYTARDSISRRGRHPQLACLSTGAVVLAWDEAAGKDGLAGSTIGLELRTARGASLFRAFVTPDTTQAGYPVVCPAGEKGAFLAYCRDKGGQTYVAYRVVHVE